MRDSARREWKGKASSLIHSILNVPAEVCVSVPPSPTTEDSARGLQDRMSRIVVLPTRLTTVILQ
jgi:hypothetical protein